MPNGDTRVDPRGEADELLEEVLTHPQHLQRAALAKICAEHPKHADILRHRYAALVKAGMLDDDEVDDGPREFGDFTLLQRIGGGGMGVVYRARQRSLDREVALKLVRPELAFFDKTQARLRREAEAIAHLDHPGILPIHAVNEEHGIPFLVMPLLVGCSLAELIATLGGRDPSQVQPGDVLACVTVQREGAVIPVWCQGTWTRIVVQVVLQVAEALVHAHARGVVHRDVKPNNVMLTRDGRVLLLDFGLAITERAANLTRPGTVMGSVAYASPEQLQGHKVDGRSDVFSLGVVLYELLALAAPFAVRTTQATVQRVLNLDPPDVRRRNRNVGDDLVAIVRHALEKEPDARYASMAMFAADLRAWLAGGEISVRADNLMRRARRWVVRQPLRAAALALLVVSALTATGWVGYWWAVKDTVAVGRDKLRADAVEAHVLNGFAELNYGSHTAAQQAFDQALTVDASSSEAAFGLSLLRQRGSQSKKTTPPVAGESATADALWRRAVWLIDDGPRGDGTVAKEACELMTRAVASARVARPMFHYDWLRAAGTAHDRIAAQRATAAAVQLWPNSHWTHFHVGTAWMELDPVRAEASLQRTMQLAPDFTLARSQMGTLALSKKGEGQDALAVLEDAVARDASKSRAWIDLGIARERAGNLVGAIEALHRAVVVQPSLPGTHYNLGRLLESTGDHIAAIAAYERALELEPRYARALQNLGLLLSDGGNHQRAVEHLRTLVQMQPDRAEAHRCLAYACFVAGDDNGALTACRDATRLAPADEEAHTLLCNVLQRRGDETALQAEQARWQATRKEVHK